MKIETTSQPVNRALLILRQPASLVLADWGRLFTNHTQCLVAIGRYAVGKRRRP